VSSRRSRNSALGRRLLGAHWRETASVPESQPSMVFKFHGQTSGVDLTRQQPLNNIAPAWLHRRSPVFSAACNRCIQTPYDEASACSNGGVGAYYRDLPHRIFCAKRRACAMSSTLLAGSYYIERLTDRDGGEDRSGHCQDRCIRRHGIRQSSRAQFRE